MPSISIHPFEPFPHSVVLYPGTEMNLIGIMWHEYRVYDHQPHDPMSLLAEWVQGHVDVEVFHFYLTYFYVLFSYLCIDCSFCFTLQ